MEVAIGNVPFQREVREWQRVDPNTGALLTGRREADRWINGPLNKYGKVVDSQNVSTPNGIQHSQRKQLEVLQARTSSGSLQVVRAHTVQTSSSRWSSSNNSSSQSTSTAGALQHFNTSSHNGMHTAAIPHNSYKTLFQQKQQAEPQMKLPTEISTKLGVGVNFLTQLDSNERETSINSHRNFIRGKSNSTEDLSAERDENNFDDDVEPVEWRRVSKIRRSLQYPKTSTPRNSYSRPPDLPENSVSVLKIKQELENGRRLNTAMRNNHVDLLALDHILNGVSEKGHKSDSKQTKKASFITAESLKEVRGKLRRLSDESLYKDDTLSQSDDLNKSDEDMDELIDGNSVTIEEVETIQDSQICLQDNKTLVHESHFLPNENTNSLETRNNKLRDMSNNEWYSRRKSYGFEKMTPPPDTSSRMQESTDSGLGRSGEFSSQWSPTETSPKGTVVALGENLRQNSSATCITLVNGSHDIKSPHSSYKEDDVKRHSIAVDEAKYVRDNLRRVFDTKTSVHLNGFYYDDLNQNGDDKDRRSKRVEFCKTEVHFAAESGRVNIVETELKPPPTNNFRRRRRTNSGGSIGASYLEAIHSGAPVTHFGDTEKKSVDSVKPKEEPVVTTSVVSSAFDNLTISKYDDDQSDEISIRGILKNKPIKPRPYHLGENIENSESLWGVRLRPTSSDFSLWQAEQDDDDDTNRDRKGDKSDIEEGPGFSIKVSLVSPQPLSLWQNKDSSSLKSTSLLEQTKRTSTCEEQFEINQSTRIRIDQQPIITLDTTVNNDLKSTSLIMKTLRSANQFDEAMKKLADLKSSFGGEPKSDISPFPTTRSNSALKLISQMNAITKSNSANSIFKESSPKFMRVKQKYSSSLDGDVILNNDDEFEHSKKYLSVIEDETKETFKIMSSASYSSSSSSSFRDTFDGQINSCYNSGGDNKKPVAAPRMKKLGPTNILSQQLSQLRRLYDAAELDSDDSAKADEEVKHYLGNLAGGSIEEKGSELSGSWSRVKAKRNVMKQTLEDETKKVDLEHKSTNEKMDLHHTNVMSIALHSPNNSLTRQHRNKVVPVAKPRTVSPVKTSRSIETTPKPIRKFPAEQKEILKVVPGARKLKEHELSYFGVNLEKPTMHTASKSNIINTSLTKTSYNNINSTNKLNDSGKWQLSSDRPDLLRHSPNVDKTNEYVNMNSNVGRSIKVDQQIDEPVYENIKVTSSKYNRKLDLERDEVILDELSKAADQILSAVTGYTDDDSNDDNKKIRSRNTPLHTIDENRSTPKSVKSKGVQVSRSYGENLKRTHHRPTKTSSDESLSRTPLSTPKLSSAHSSARKSSSSRIVEEEKTRSISSSNKSSRKRVPSSTESRRMHRTSSRDTLNASSSEDLPNVHVEVPRRHRRIKPKEKSEISTSSGVRSSETHHRTSSSSRPAADRSSSRRSSSDHHRSSSSTRPANDRPSSSRRSHKVDGSSSKITSKSPTNADQPKVRVKGGVVTTTSSSRRSNRHPDSIWK